MCPIFRLAPAEESSPRAKANLMRAILTGQLDPATLTKDEFKGVADLCVNCQMCRLECPASVDIPRLMIEGKGAFVPVNGLSTSDWAMSRIDWLCAWGSLLWPLANWALANRPARWLMEKTIGLAQGRKLPRFAPRSFMRLAARRRLTRSTRRSGRKVLYFVDTYANYHDPQLGEALVAVMEHNGVAVYVHPGQGSSGMPMISLGALGRSKRLAARNVALLAEAVRQGYHDRGHRTFGRAGAGARVSGAARRRRRRGWWPKTPARPARISGSCTRPATCSSTCSRSTPRSAITCPAT